MREDYAGEGLFRWGTRFMAALYITVAITCVFDKAWFPAGVFIGTAIGWFEFGRWALRQ